MNEKLKEKSVVDYLKQKPLSNGVWVLSDWDALVCIETRTLIYIHKNSIVLDTLGDSEPYPLWKFNDEKELEKKFDWLKSILIGGI